MSEAQREQANWGLLNYKSGLERNNALSVFAMGALPAIAGSAISVMVVAFFIWAVISLALRRFEFRLTSEDRFLAWVFTIFVALILATALLGENQSEIWRSTIWLIPFLSVWVIIPRLRASPDLDYLGLYVLGACVGAVGSLIFGLVEVVGLGSRAEGGAGNAAVYAMMSLCLGAIGGLNITNPNRNYRILAFAAVVAALMAVVLSLTRGVLVAAAFALLILLFYAPQIWRSTTRLAMVAVGSVIVAIVVLYGAYDIIEARTLQTVREIEMVMAGENTASIGERLRLWVAGWEVIRDSPLWGHGIQNRMNEVMAVVARDYGETRGFTHAHNAYITFAIDGGLIVLIALLALLAAPVVVARRTLQDGDHRKRLFLALQVSVIYAVCGVTQIMFKHDIMDSFFIFSAMVVAASVPYRRPDDKMATPDETSN